MSEAFTIWITGLACSGKTSTGAAVAEALRVRGLIVEFLDSGRIRATLNRSLGFSREEIESSVLRLGYECSMLNRNGVVAIVTAVSPYRDARERVRKQIDRFIEVYCRCPMEVLAKRDDSDLFARAERGEVQHVAGVNAPYEEPTRPEVVLDTDRLTVEESRDLVLAALESLGHLDRVMPACYTPDEEAIIRQRLQDLGYL